MVKARSPAATQVGRQPHQRHREEAQDPAQRQCVRPLHPAGRHRAAFCAAHPRVDVGIEAPVERGGRARADGDAEDGDGAQHRADGLARANKAGERREHHKRHHPRLPQRDEVLPARRRAGVGGDSSVVGESVFMP